jgi:hypothetical protein
MEYIVAIPMPYRNILVISMVAVVAAVISRIMIYAIEEL